MSDPLLLHYLWLQRLLPAVRTRTTKQAIILIISTTQAIILIITTITTTILIINTLVVHISCVTITLEVCFCNSSNILFYHCICCLLSSLKWVYLMLLQRGQDIHIVICMTMKSGKFWCFSHLGEKRYRLLRTYGHTKQWIYEMIYLYNSIWMRYNLYCLILVLLT